MTSIVDISDAATQSVGHALEQLIADRMPEGVIDALQMIKVEVQDRQPLSALNTLECLFKPFVIKFAIGQTSQRIMLCRIRKPFLGTPLFGDVFVGGDPSAAFDRVAYHGNDPPVAQARNTSKDSSLADCGHDVGDILLGVVGGNA